MRTMFAPNSKIQSCVCGEFFPVLGKTSISEPRSAAESEHPTMESTIGRRIFIAHLELSYRLGRRVTLAEVGCLVAERLGRDTPFAATAVSKWEAGLQTPSLEVIEAIAELSGVDPGWISHGAKSAAPEPRAVGRPERVELSQPHARRVRKAATPRGRQQNQSRKRDA
jgi:transcriptional regulator with XRE-family HTH domain